MSGKKTKAAEPVVAGGVVPVTAVHPDRPSNQSGAFAALRDVDPHAGVRYDDEGRLVED